MQPAVAGGQLVGSAATALSSFGVNTIVGTSNPAAAANAFSSAASTFARLRRLVVTRTLPVLM